MEFPLKALYHRFKAWVLVGFISDLAPIVEQAVLLELNKFVTILTQKPESVMRRPCDEAKLTPFTRKAEGFKHGNQRRLLFDLWKFASKKVPDTPGVNLLIALGRTELNPQHNLI
jgi:hypothetical protein